MARKSEPVVSKEPDIVDEQSQTAGQMLDESDHEKLITRLNRNIKQALDRSSKMRLHKRKDYDFYASHQWDEEDKATLEEQGRPAVAFNRTNKVINAVRGMEVQNRQELTFYPIDEGDQGLSDLSNESVSFCRKNCDAEDEESEAFTDLAICGEGWTETLIDYTEDPDGMYKKERRDPLEMGVDPRSTKANYDDARYLFHVKAYTAQEMRANGWKTDEIVPAKFSWYDGPGIYDDPKYQPRDYPGLDDANNEDDLEPNVFEVYKYQEYELEDFYRVSDPQSGAEFQLSAEEFERVKDEYIEPANLEWIKQQRKVYKQYILCGGTLLNAPEGEEKEQYAAPVNGFTFRAMTGLRDRNRREWFGLMRLMREPQQWANKFFVQVQHIINTSAKGGKLLYEPNAFLRPQQVNDDWAQAGKAMALQSGGLTKYKIEPGGNYPEGVDRLLNYALTAIDDVIGIDPAMFSQPKTGESGYLLALRQETSVTILASLFDAKRRYTKECGRIDIMFVRKYLSDGRLIKIDGDNGNAKFIPLLRDNVNFKYHIEVGDSPSSPNQKTKNFQILMALLPAIKDMGVPVPPSALKLTPFDGKFISDWMQYIDQAKNDPQKQKTTAMQEALAQAQLQSIGLDNATKAYKLQNVLPAEVLTEQSTAGLNVAKAQNAGGQNNLGDNIINAEIAQVNAAAQKTKALAEIIKANTGLQAERIKAANTHLKNIGEITKAQNQPQNPR